MTKKELRQELVEAYGAEAYNTAVEFINIVGEYDGAWAMAQDEGLDEVVEIIEELMNFASEN
jgi:hypothetical protein